MSLRGMLAYANAPRRKQRHQGPNPRLANVCHRWQLPMRFRLRHFPFCIPPADHQLNRCRGGTAAWHSHSISVHARNGPGQAVMRRSPAADGDPARAALRRSWGPRPRVAARFPSRSALPAIRPAACCPAVRLRRRLGCRRGWSAAPAARSRWAPEMVRSGPSDTVIDRTVPRAGVQGAPPWPLRLGATPCVKLFSRQLS